MASPFDLTKKEKQMPEINPRVVKASARVPFDAADYTWVDIQDFAIDEVVLKPVAMDMSEHHVDKLPLLFERMAVIPPRHQWDVDSVITVEREGRRIVLRMWALDRAEYAFQATIKEADDGAHTLLLDFDVPKEHYATMLKTFGNDRKKAELWMSGGTTQLMTCLYQATINSRTVEETYTCPTNPANVKRRRQGKMPMYEWKTLVIDATIRKRIAAAVRAAKPREPQREHGVRGHWAVRKKSGKRYWVKAHKRGDASKGTIFHDYTTQGD